MLRRNLASSWVGGAHLFPGGSVDDGDGSAEVLRRARGRDDAEASRILGLLAGGLAWYAAAIRECFEEAGVLLCCGPGGSPIDFTDPGVAARYVEHRRALNAGELGFAELCEREDLGLDAGRLSYLSHWITPEGEPRRYDTRFFVAEMPEGQEALHDDIEVIDSLWTAPQDALRRLKAGEIHMLFPTMKNLEAIGGYARVSDLLEAVAQAEVPTILPRITEDGEGARMILLPGDARYER